MTLEPSAGGVLSCFRSGSAISAICFTCSGEYKYELQKVVFNLDRDISFLM
jgi:hypothetical protein